MKRDTVNYLAVGAVVLGAFAALIIVLLMITGRTGDTERYHAFYDNVAGLSYGTPVFYEGFRIGQVDDVIPHRETGATRYEVGLALREDWTIPKGSVAIISAAGLLSDVSIAIREGEGPGVIEPGGEIPGQGGGDLFGAIGELAAGATDLTNQRLAPLLDLVTRRVDEITASLGDQTPELLNEANRFLGQINETANSLNLLLGETNRSEVSQTLVNLRQTSSNAASLSGQLQTTRQQVDDLMLALNQTVAENRPDLRKSVMDLSTSLDAIALRMDSVSENLDQASRNINEFTRDVRRSPGRLLSTQPDDEVEDIE